MQPSHSEMNHATLPPGSPWYLRDFLRDCVGSLCSLHAEYGDVVTFTKGDSRAVFAFGPDYNREVLTKSDVFYLSSGLPGPKTSAQRRFGHGLFGLNGQRHQLQRRLLMPPFRKEAVDSYAEFVAAHTEEFLTTWQAGQVVNMADQMNELALRITSRLLFGVGDLDTARRVEAVFEEWMKLNHENYFAALLPIESPPGHYDDMLDAAERLEVQIKALVRERRANPSETDDVLTILLAANDAGEMSDNEVGGNMHTLFNAAYHTTASALIWTMFLLVQHPRIMQDVLDELHGVLGGATPTATQLGRLPLLDRAIKESMRIFPPVIYAPRINIEAVTLGEHELPKGTVVVTSQYVTHHMPDLFERPETFLPDRWLTDNPSPYAYFPFGAGSRMCLGAPFAMMMLKTSLAMIFQRFRMTVVADSRIDRQCSLTLGPRQGIPMSIWRQDRQFSTTPVHGNVNEMVHLPPPDRKQAAAG